MKVRLLLPQTYGLVLYNVTAYPYNCDMGQTRLIIIALKQQNDNQHNDNQQRDIHNE